MVNELVKQGKVLTDSEQVGQWGAPTFDVRVVRKDFADKHPAVVAAFVTRALAVPERVRGNIYRPVALQITQLGQPMEQTIRDTAEFLKQQGKIPQVDSDYSAYVTDRLVQQVQAAPQP